MAIMKVNIINTAHAPLLNLYTSGDIFFPLLILSMAGIEHIKINK